MFKSLIYNLFVLGRSTKKVPCHKAWGRESTVISPVRPAAALLKLKYSFILLYKGGWGWWKGEEAGIHNGKKKKVLSALELTFYLGIVKLFA